MNRIAPYEDLMVSARNMAGKISESVPISFRAVKEPLLRSCYDLPLEQGVRVEDLLRRIIGETEDAREGMSVLVERRKADFKRG